MTRTAHRIAGPHFPEPRRVKSRAANLALVAITLLVMLPVLEGMLRLAPKSLFDPDASLKGDPLLGVPLQFPDVRADFPVQPKPGNVYRIVVLGDSHAVSVKKHSTYAKVLERLLNEDDLHGKRVEVYNAGAPGHSHYQYYLTLRERLLVYQPDLVIVGFYIGNDWLDLYRNDDRPALAFEGGQFVHKDPEFLKYDDPHDASWIRSLRLAQPARRLVRSTIGYQAGRVEALWTVAEQSGQGWTGAADYLYAVTRGYFVNQHIFRQSMNQILYLERFPDQRPVLERINRKVTELMKDLAERQHIKLLYMPSPTKLQIEPDSDAQVVDKTLQICGYDRNALRIEDQLTQSLVALLNELNVDWVDVEAKLRQRARGAVLFDETYHLTENAHAIVGQALHDRVKALVSGPQ